MLWLTSSIVPCLLIWLLSASLGACTDDVLCKDSLQHHNGLDMTVNCSTGLVSWQLSTEEPAYEIYVTYQCDGNNSIINNVWQKGFGDDSPSSDIAPNIPRQSQICVFRICYQRPGKGSRKFQSTPQTCNYTGSHDTDTTEQDSSSLFSTPTASYSTHTQTIDLSTISNIQKTSLLTSSYYTQTKIVTKPYSTSVANLPIQSTGPLTSIADTDIVVFSMLGSIVLIFILVSLFSAILTLKIKRSVRFSKGVNKNMIIISEEASLNGLDMVYKGSIGSCTSLVTVIQPLQKDERLNSTSTPLMNVYKNTVEDTKLSLFCQEEYNEKTSLSLSCQSVDSSSIIQTVSERVITPADIAVILPDDNSGYISYKCSDDYITSIHSPHEKTVMANNIAEENYDGFSLYSQY